MPFVGALITNSQMPTKLAMGLVRLPPALMHVSPGLGTSRYAPFRFLCRPEATVLELVPGGAQEGPRSVGDARSYEVARSRTRS